MHITSFIFQYYSNRVIFFPGQSLADSSNGQGFVWFFVLYCVVSYIKKYRIERFMMIPFRGYVLAIILCMAFLVASKYGLAYVSSVIGNGGNGSMRFYFNCSVPVVVISLSVFFVAIKFPRLSKTTNLISSMTATTLGIYIIHAQPSLNGIIWGDVGLMLREHSSHALVLDILVVLIVFFSSMIIEMIRIKLIK